MLDTTHAFIVVHMSALSCRADAYRYGQWEPSAAASPRGMACANYSYVNASCGTRPLSSASLCEALHDSSSAPLLLMVGDSLMLKMWESLMFYVGGRPHYDLEDCKSPLKQVVAASSDHKRTKAKRRLRGGKIGCEPCCCKAYSIQCGAGRAPIRVRFVRHNHLIGDFLPHGGAACPKCAKEGEESSACIACRKILDARVNCVVWREPDSLKHATTLLLGTGTHLLEVPNNTVSGTFERRAEELAAFLDGQKYGKIIYMLSPWGEKEHHQGFSGPTEAAPPDAMYSWDRIPSVNAEYQKAMRAKGFAVIDPTLALTQRKDCRFDYMHSMHGVYAQSAWKMLVAAAASKT